jgi:thiol-disulfide isomerase/thioredoxin
MRFVVMWLLLGVAPATAAQNANPASTRERFEALLKEYQAAEETWDKQYGETRLESRVSEQVARHRDWPGWDFAPRFVALAEADQDDPAAQDALFWVVDRALNVGIGIRRLATHHQRALEMLARSGRLNEERVGAACRLTLNRPAPWTERFLRDLPDRLKNRDARGLVILGLARLLQTRAAMARDPWFDEAESNSFAAYSRDALDPGYVDYIRRTDPGACEAEAERLFERAARDFGDVISRKDPRPGGHDETVSEVAERELKELRTLAIGRLAQNIEGRDAEGRAFRLSDYRGKVVVLTFSGNWCGPCKGMYPQERNLVERYKERPFTLLSVNTDTDRETLRKSIRDGEITWRCWWDGGTDGPITSAWGVTSFPTVIIIDAQGVIRRKNVRDDRLAKAVNRLLIPPQAPGR